MVDLAWIMQKIWIIPQPYLHRGGREDMSLLIKEEMPGIVYPFKQQGQ